ncbi:hypothetical protein [Bacillus sp. NPDC094106]|uniref:hypothetical protein n=1 Tax=Bacillus sp. NPDC094106 TaxID=3363949 RepID=UPI0037FC39FB
MLEEVKKDFELGSVSYPPYINLTEEQVEWLIKQAEIVEAIREEIKGRWSTEKVSVNRLYGILEK